MLRDFLQDQSSNWPKTNYSLFSRQGSSEQSTHCLTNYYVFSVRLVETGLLRPCEPWVPFPLVWSFRVILLPHLMEFPDSHALIAVLLSTGGGPSVVLIFMVVSLCSSLLCSYCLGALASLHSLGPQLLLLNTGTPLWLSLPVYHLEALCRLYVGAVVGLTSLGFLSLRNHTFIA